MSTSSAENPSTTTNPYTAPKSVASPFTKSYLTLALCSGLIAGTVIGGIWMYSQSTNPESIEEPELFIDRRPPD